MDFPSTYALILPGGKEAAKGECSVRLNEESLGVSPKSGSPILYSLRDIIEISEKDYTVYIETLSNELLEISKLGHNFEDFLRLISKFRNTLILKDMLVDESGKKSSFECEFQLIGSQPAKCEVRVFGTALAVLPDKAEVIRIHLSDIVKHEALNHVLAIDLEDGSKFVFSKLGYNLDSLNGAITEAIGKLELMSLEQLKALLPDFNDGVLRKAAQMMKDGKAASRKELEKLSADLWPAIEKKLEYLKSKDEYDFLSSLSAKENIAVGLKKGLMGSLTGVYLWMLFPLIKSNAMAMEAFSTKPAEEEEGRATYFFRITNGKGRSLAATDINRCLLDISFRREPIYLPDEKLEDPQYSNYKYAVRKLPSLKTLRNLYLGKVAHQTPEQWKKDITELLKSKEGGK